MVEEAREPGAFHVSSSVQQQPKQSAPRWTTASVRVRVRESGDTWGSPSSGSDYLPAATWNTLEEVVCVALHLSFLHHTLSAAFAATQETWELAVWLRWETFSSCGLLWTGSLAPEGRASCKYCEVPEAVRDQRQEPSADWHPVAPVCLSVYNSNMLISSSFS